MRRDWNCYDCQRSNDTLVKDQDLKNRQINVEHDSFLLLPPKKILFSFSIFVSSRREARTLVRVCSCFPLSENRSYAINFVGTGWAEFIFTPLCLPRLVRGCSAAVLSFPLRLLLVFGYFACPIYLVKVKRTPWTRPRSLLDRRSSPPELI